MKTIISKKIVLLYFQITSCPMTVSDNTNCWSGLKNLENYLSQEETRKGKTFMTEGQIRYQTVMENQRHNLATEKYAEIQANASAEQAKAATEQARIKAAEHQENVRFHDVQAGHYYNQDQIGWRNTGTNIVHAWTDAFKGLGQWIGSLFA